MLKQTTNLKVCISSTFEDLIEYRKKAIEAWFLADSDLLSSLTNDKITKFEYPEITDEMPYETLI